MGAIEHNHAALVILQEMTLGVSLFNQSLITPLLQIKDSGGATLVSAQAAKDERLCLRALFWQDFAVQ